MPLEGVFFDADFGLTGVLPVLLVFTLIDEMLFLEEFKLMFMLQVI